MSLDMVGKVTRAKSRGARDMASVIMHLHDEEMKLKHEKVARTVIPSKKQVLEKEVDDFLERKLQSEIERKYIPGSPLAKQVIASTRSKAQIKPQGQPDQVFVGQTHNFTYVLDSHGHVLIDDDLRLVQPEDITFTQEGKIMVDRSAGNKAKAAAEEQSKKEGSDRQTQTSRRLSSKSEPNFRPLVRDAIEEISRDYHQTVEASVAKYGFVPSCYSEKNFQTRPINLAKTLDKEETRKKVNKQKIYDHTESLLFEATQEESDRRLELACWHAMNEKHRASIGSPIKLQPRHSPEFWQDLVDEKIGLLRSARFAYFVSRNPDLEAVKAIAPDWVERGEISDWDQYHFWLSRNADGSTKGYNQLVYEQGANNRGVHLKDHRHLLSAQIAQMKKDALVSRASALIDSDRRIANQSLEAAKYQKLLQRGGLLSSASPMRHQEFESMLGKFDNYGQGQMSVSFDEEGQVRSGIVSSDPPRKASKPPKKASSRKIEFGFAPLIRRKEGSAIVDEPPEGLLTGSHSSQERITYVDGQAVEERSSTYRFADDDAHHVVEDLLPDRLRKTAISTGHTSTKSVGAERPPSKKAVDAERLPSTKSAGAERPPLTKWAGAERPPATKSASAERPPSTKSASAERQILTKSIGVVNEVVGRRNGSVNGGAERGDTIEPGSASRGAVQGPTDDVDSGAIPQDGVDEEVPGIEARGGDQYEDAGASGDEDYTPRSDRNANDPTTEQRPGFGSAVYRMMAPRPGLEEDFPRERASSQRPPSYKLPSGVSGPGPVSYVDMYPDITGKDNPAALGSTVGASMIQRVISPNIPQVLADPHYLCGKQRGAPGQQIADIAVEELMREFRTFREKQLGARAFKKQATPILSSAMRINKKMDGIAPWKTWVKTIKTFDENLSSWKWLRVGKKRPDGTYAYIRVPNEGFYRKAQDGEHVEKKGPRLAGTLPREVEVNVYSRKNPGLCTGPPREGGVENLRRVVLTRQRPSEARVMRELLEAQEVKDFVEEHNSIIRDAGTTVQEKKELQEQKGKLASALAVGVVEDFVAGNVIKGSVAPEEADKVSEHIISQPGLVDSLAARMQTLFGGTQKPVRVTRTQLATMRGPTKNEDGTPRKYSRFRATGHSRYTAAEVDEEPRVDVNQILMSPTNRGKQGGNLFDLESPDPRGPTSAEFGHDEHAEIKLPSPDTVMEEVQPILQDALWNALKEDDDAHENNYNHQEENEKTSPMSLNKNEQMAAMSFAAPRKNMAEGEAHPSRNGHSRASRSSYAHYQAGRKNNDNFGRGAGAGGRAGGRASSIGTKPQFMFMSDPATGPQRFGQDSTERSVQLEANKAKQQHQPERVLSAELISGAFQRFLDAAERLEKQVSAHRALRKVSKLGRIDVQPGIESKSKLSSTDDDGEDESVEKSQDDDVDAPAISTKYPEQKNGVGEREDGLASSHKTSSTNREQADHDHQEDGDEPGGFFAVLEQSSKSSTNSVRSTRASKNIKIESSKQHHSSSAVPLAGDLHRGHSSTATSTSSSRSFEVEDGAGAAAAEQTANAARLGKPSKEQKDYLRNRTDDKKRHFDKDCLSTAGAPSAAAVDASRPVATHLSATTGETKSGMRTTVEVSSPASCSNVQDLMSTSAFTSDMLKDILARSVVATTTPSPDKESRGAVERTSQREPLTSSVSLSAPRLGELRPQPLRADDDRRLSSYQDALAHAAHQQQSQQLLGHDVTLDNQTRMIDGLGHGGPPRGADHSSSGHVSRVSLSASSSATQPAVVEIIRTSQEHQMTYNDVTYNSYSTRSKNAGDEHGSSAAPLREISSTSSSSSAVLDELNAHVAAGGVVQPRIGEPSGSDLLPRARPDTSSGSSVFQHSAHAGSGGALSGAIATTAGPSTMASSNIVSTSIATPPSDHHPWGSAPSAGATGVEDHAWLSSYRSATATASSSTTIGGIGNMSTNTTSTNPLLQKASTMRSLFLQRPGMTRPGPTSSSLSENADRNQQVVQQQQQANAMMSRTIDTGAAGGAPVFRPPRIGAVAADNKPMRPTALR